MYLFLSLVRDNGESDLSSDHGHPCCQRREINGEIGTSSSLRDTVSRRLRVTQEVVLRPPRAGSTKWVGNCELGEKREGGAGSHIGGKRSWASSEHTCLYDHGEQSVTGKTKW